MSLLERFRNDPVLRMELLRSLLSCYVHGVEVEMPRVVQASSAEYVDANDVIGQFISGLVRDDNAFFTGSNRAPDTELRNPRKRRGGEEET